MCKRRVLLRREEQHHHQFDRADYREKGKKKGRERERKRNGCCSTALATLESRGKDEILCASR